MSESSITEVNSQTTIQQQSKKQSQQQLTSTEQINALSSKVLSDCNLKKGKQAKFIKHIEMANLMYDERKEHLTKSEMIAFAGLYKNIGKLGEHEQSLERAIQLIQKHGDERGVAIRWSLQLAALKSSRKLHQECYLIAVKAFSQCVELLQIYQQNEPENSPLKLFISTIIVIAQQITKDQIVWQYNDRSIAEELLIRLKRQCNSSFPLPYYADYQFHIADYMSLQECPAEWEQSNLFDARQAAIFLSISCFTMTTEKYYLKDYSQKTYHIKALKIALCAFEINCSYVAFLLKILHQHFGKRLQSIEQQHSETADAYQMRRTLPKDKKQVSLKSLSFAE